MRKKTVGLLMTLVITALLPTFGHAQTTQIQQDSQNQKLATVSRKNARFYADRVWVIDDYQIFDDGKSEIHAYRYELKFFSQDGHAFGLSFKANNQLRANLKEGQEDDAYAVKLISVKVLPYSLADKKAGKENPNNDPTNFIRTEKLPPSYSF